jgi:N-terminal domain of toast_rack, DUF2154
MRRAAELVAVALLAMLLAAACGASQAGELQTESEAVERGDAESVRTNLKMAAGELKVGGGADSLMEADFAYNVLDWKPKVTYEDVSSGTGTLSVEQPVENRSMRDDDRNEWDIHLNDGVPTSLHVVMGAGESDFDLSGLTLTGLDLRIGAGPSTVNLAGDWDRDVDASIQGGAGDATVRLPSRMGVRVDVAGGLGEVQVEGLSRDGDAYVNDAYGESEATLNVDIEGGVGLIRLEVV